MGWLAAWARVPKPGHSPTFWVCFDLDFTVCFTRRLFPVSFALRIYSGDLEVSWDVVWDAASVVAL